MLKIELSRGFRLCLLLAGTIWGNAAVAVEDAQTTTMLVPLVPLECDKRVIVPYDSIDINWNANRDFDDSQWLASNGAPGGIGYDVTNTYNRWISLNVQAEMLNRNTTCYIRIPFLADPALLPEIDYLALRIRYDDGFVAYLNGKKILAINAESELGWRSVAINQHRSEDYETYDLTDHLKDLMPGENLFAVHGLNISRGSIDFLVQFELVGRKNYYRNFASHLPIISIQTDAPGRIPHTAPITAGMAVFNVQPGQANRLSNPVDLSCQVLVMGDGTIYDYPKEHYYFGTVDGSSQPVDVALLDLPAGDQWTLYAPYSDKTMVRNYTAGILGRKMGFPATRSQFCHLFLNGDYAGMYLLAERNNVSRLGISPLPPAAQSGDELTGGYILALQRRRVDGIVSAFPPFPGAAYPVLYQYNYPSAEEITPAQRGYLDSFMEGFEANLMNDTGGSLHQANLATFINYFLMNEMTRTINGYRCNTMLYKDRDSTDGRLCILPEWNYEYAFGNVDFYNGWETTGWNLDFLLEDDEMRSDSLFVPQWWRPLFSDSTFRSQLKVRWQELRATILTEKYLADLSDSLYAVIESERNLNFERWPVLGKIIAPNLYSGATYDEEYDDMWLWFFDRLDWMEVQIPQLVSRVKTGRESSTPDRCQVYQNYPNPFNPSTTFRIHMAEAAELTVSIYTVHGKEVIELVHQQVPAGMNAFAWDGCDGNGLKAASGVYQVVMSDGRFTSTLKAVLLR